MTPILIATTGNGATLKLTWRQAQEICDKYKLGKTIYQELADEYGVTADSIANIIKNKTFHDPDYTHSALAREFNVSNKTIAMIIRNETYCDPNYTTPSSDEIRRWKLSNDDIAAINSEYMLGNVSHLDLAKEYGVNPSQIASVIRKNGGTVRALSSRRPSRSGRAPDGQQLSLL